MAVSRGPLNYTTTVDPGKSASECIDILIKHGARKVGMSVGEDRMPDGIEFVIDTQFGPRSYSMEVDAARTRKVLLDAYSEGRVERRHTEPAHAARVAWRVMKDWLEAQMAMIETGLVSLDQVMLPYMRVDDGHTLYSAWQENERAAIEAAGARA
jgi:hypothetical protein